HLQPKRLLKPILKISILKNIKRLLRTLYGTHILFQCILLCFDTLPLDRDIPLLDRDVPLLDRDVRILALGRDALRDALRNALLYLVATKGLYSIPNTKLRHMWPNDRNC